MSLSFRLHTIMEMRILEFILRFLNFLQRENFRFFNYTRSAECSAMAINLVLITDVSTTVLYVGESISIDSR